MCLCVCVVVCVWNEEATGLTNRKKFGRLEGKYCVCLCGGRWNVCLSVCLCVCNCVCVWT